MAKLQPRRPDGSEGNAPPTIPRQPQARDLGEEVGGGSTVSGGENLQEEVPHAGEPEARRYGGRQHQEDCFAVLPTQDGALQDWAVPQLDEEPAHPAMLVVPMPLTDERPPLQGVSGMEDATENSVGGGKKGDQEVEEQVDGPGPAGRREMCTGSAGLFLLHGRGKGRAARRRR